VPSEQSLQLDNDVDVPLKKLYRQRLLRGSGGIRVVEVLSSKLIPSILGEPTYISLFLLAVKLVLVALPLHQVLLTLPVAARALAQGAFFLPAHVHFLVGVDFVGVIAAAVRALSHSKI
jgi:hypothetical protein